MAVYKPILMRTRILDADRTALAADEADYTVNRGTKPNLIYVAQLDEEKGAYASTYTLMWKNTTDAGSFTNLAATGQINWAATTNLGNGTAVTARSCTGAGASGSTWQNGEEVEGAATCDSINLADEYYTEVHFAINIASALEGKTYDFQIWENTGGTALVAAAAASLIVTSDQPSVVLNTADAYAFGTDTTPTLEFTGTDASDSDIRYNIQIDTADFTGTYSLKYADLWFTKTGDPTDNLTLEIRTSSFTGSVVATANVLAATSVTSNQFNRFTFSSAVTLNAATKYYFVLTRSGARDTSNYIAWRGATGAYAHGGKSTKISAVWSAEDTTLDFNFILYDSSLVALLTQNGTIDISNSLYGGTGTGEALGQSFTAPGFIINKFSGTDLGFDNTTDVGVDTDPFDSGDKCDYDVQVGDALTTGTYYWRVRGMDPSPGSGTYGAWTATRSFTIETTPPETKFYITHQ